MNKLFFTFYILFVSGILLAQVPSGYYSSANGKSGFELKTELYNIIKDHNSRGYSALWGFISSTDIDTYYEKDGTILDIYSENPASTDPYNFTKISDQCGSYSGEGSCYNREHSFPKSWFGGSVEPMNSDVHHMFASDGKVNSIRGNYPYGNVSSASQTSQNGSKVGSSAVAGYTGTVFEPIDEFKGDVARAHFYMATRYQNIISSWQSNTTQSNDVLDGSSNKVFEDWMLNVLLEWHKNDPVSQKEIDRNNAAYSYQGNRNPYVDYPEFVNCIWGNGCGAIEPPDTTTLVDTTKPDTVIESSCKDVLFLTSDDKPMWSEQLVVTKNNGATVSTFNSIYALIADTLISGFRYSKLYRLSSNIYTSVGGQYVGGIRSDSCGYVYYLSVGGAEQLLYDFSKDEGDIALIGHEKKQFLIGQESSLNLEDGSIGKVVSVSEQGKNYSWLDGVGNLHGLLAHINVYPTGDDSYEPKLLCFMRNNKLVYKNAEEGCFPENSVTGLVTQTALKTNVYPQPFSNKLSVSFDRHVQADLTIYSLTGQELIRGKVQGTNYVLETKQLPAGTFIMLIRSSYGEILHSQPIIKD